MGADEHNADAAYQAYHDANTRFNYFVTGGAGALLAYAMQSYAPGGASVAPLLAPAAWVLLGASLGGGLWHLSLGVDILLDGYRLNKADQSLDTLRKSLAAGESAHEYDTVENVPHGAIPVRIGELEADRLATGQRVARLQRRQRAAEIIRNVGLLGGFAALALWRMLNL